MVYVKKKRVLGKAPVKNKNKNKNKNTNTQISTQNQNVHIHLSEKTKRAPRTTKPKPKPKPKDDLSPYELMVYRNTHLQPTYSYNLPLNEKLNVQTPDYTKQLENILLEFRTSNTRQPMIVNNVVESKNESDERNLKDSMKQNINTMMNSKKMINQKQQWKKRK